MHKLPEHKNRKEIPEYHTWKNMRARCNAPCNKNNREYQIKGIKVCQRWEDFVNFYHDMGPKPTVKHSIDRIDNDGDYTPENCRWADHTQQANNKSNNKLVNYAEKVWTVPDLARYLEVSIIALRKHLDKGRSVEEALSRIDNNTYLEFNGIKKSRKEWAEEYGISLSKLYVRLHTGWTIEEALLVPNGGKRKDFISPSKH